MTMICRRMVSVSFHIYVFVYFMKSSLGCPDHIEILDRGMTIEDRITILNAHNKVRGLIANGSVFDQPKACNMMKMTYDMNLEVLSEKLVDTCIFDHLHVTDARWEGVGQNLFAWAGTHPSPGPEWESALYNWFDENHLYRFPIYNYPAGHYTQVVWSDSTCLGCSYVYYYDKKEDFPYRKMYVCHYGPGGNIKDVAPYEVGCDTCRNELCIPSKEECSGIIVNNPSDDFFENQVFNINFRK